MEGVGGDHWSKIRALDNSMLPSGSVGALADRRSARGTRLFLTWKPLGNKQRAVGAPYSSYGVEEWPEYID
jgi:hypothetical protein